MSFYSLPSSILNHVKHSTLNAAYTFYYATEAALGPTTTDEVASGSSSGEESLLKERKKQRLRALMKDLLIEAKAVRPKRFPPAALASSLASNP
jgi:glycylpeptide N-tetradecanoyltransferase